MGSAADVCNMKGCKTAIVSLCREPQIACLLVHSFSKGFAVQIRSRAGAVSCAFALFILHQFFVCLTPS